MKTSKLIGFGLLIAGVCSGEVFIDGIKQAPVDMSAMAAYVPLGTDLVTLGTSVDIRSTPTTSGLMLLQAGTNGPAIYLAEPQAIAPAGLGGGRLTIWGSAGTNSASIVIRSSAGIFLCGACGINTVGFHMDTNQTFNFRQNVVSNMNLRALSVGLDPGTMKVVDATQLVFIVGVVTNVLDPDILNP